MKEYTARQQFEAYENNDWALDKCYYFYDWFCRTGSLRGKCQSLMPKVRWFAKTMNIDLDRTYFWFKNNCPGCGSLYDDFRFADIETQDILYTVIPSSGHFHGKGRSEVWSPQNDFKEPLYLADSWSQMKKLLVTGNTQKTSIAA